MKLDLKLDSVFLMQLYVNVE